MLLEPLGIYGWKKRDENLVLASLLTGDPLLLIGNHGCAKTHIANKIAQALAKPFLAYDASKAMFEDVLGYPNMEKLQKGIVEYVPSPVTVWDKEIILIDELNRAIPELQSKWLELIRSRKIMGFDTKVKWVWSAMNPMSYAGAQALDEALIGRFALFLYPPDILQMDESDRIRITTHINGDDAPSLNEWSSKQDIKTVFQVDVLKTGIKIQDILTKAAEYFYQLRSEMSTLSEFLAKFACLVLKESKEEITLDGRRMGFIYRNILANRSVEMAQRDVLGLSIPSLTESAKYVVQSSIPIGLNETSVNREETLHTIDVCFDLLSQYFDENSQIWKVDLIYELFTTHDLIRKAQILLTEELGDLVHSKAWNDLADREENITLLAYTALQAETECPGIIPKELLDKLSRKIDSKDLSTESFKSLKDESIEWLDEIENLIQQRSGFERLIAIQRVKTLVMNGSVTQSDIEETKQRIEGDLRTYQILIQNARKASSTKEAAA